MPQVNEKEAGVEEEKTTEEMKTGKTAVTIHMLDLPPEIQRRILACLPNESLSKSVRPVCRAWDQEALSIIGEVYLRFCHRFSAANLDNLYPDKAKPADKQNPAHTYKVFLDLEKTLRHYFGPLMESGLPCFIPGLILDDTIRAFDWLLTKPDKDSFTPIRWYNDNTGADSYLALLAHHMTRITNAWSKGHFQCYFTRLMSLQEVPMGRRDLRLPPSRTRCSPYYNAPVEITRLRNEAHSYRRQTEEAKAREEALLRALAQKAETDEELKRLLTQHKETLHLSRAQDAEEERARLWDESRNTLQQLQAEMIEERERYRDLCKIGVRALRPHVEHEKAIVLMEVERFKALVHQAKLTPPLHIQAEKKCVALRDLMTQAEDLLPRLRSQADNEQTLLGRELEYAEMRLQRSRDTLAQLQQEPADPADEYYHDIVSQIDFCQDAIAREEVQPGRLRRQANLEWALYQTRAEKMEEERERLLALLARQPEQEEALLRGEQGQGRLQDGDQEVALPHPHLPPLSTKDPTPH